MSLFKKKRIFLDSAAGRNNPSAIYKEGVEAKKRLENARAKIARLLHVQARDIIFTSGGTESDNVAILGAATPGSHIVISSFEHPAIMESAREFERRGGEVSIVEDVIAAIKENTSLVSVMYVNNETGAIQPIHKISRSLKGPYLHTDASQAAELLPLDVSALGVDMMTLDGKKLGVPGVGLLVVRPLVKIKPIIFGGGQERGLRAGTEHVEAIVIFADKLVAAQEKRKEVWERLAKLQEFFLAEIQKNLPEAVINTPKESIPSIVSVSFPGKLHEFLAIQLDEKGVAVSTGSSCKSRSAREEKEALRFSFNAETTEKDLQETISILKKIMV